MKREHNQGVEPFQLLHDEEIRSPYLEEEEDVIALFQRTEGILAASRGSRCWKIGYRRKTRVPSTKTCSHCGYVLPKLSLKTREWICPNCGVTHDRDVNAAINILNFSTRGRLSPKVTHAESHTTVQLQLDRVSQTGIRSPGT